MVLNFLNYNTRIINTYTNTCTHTLTCSSICVCICVVIKFFKYKSQAFAAETLTLLKSTSLSTHYPEQVLSSIITLIPLFNYLHSLIITLKISLKTQIKQSQCSNQNQIANPKWAKPMGLSPINKMFKVSITKSMILVLLRTRMSGFRGN